MFMEQLFQNISKQMLEITYTLRLGQLLKIAPNFKKNIWQILKPKKPNIVNKVIPEPSVAILIETHSKVNIIAIELNNQMVVIQVQVGKNIVEDVLLDGRASVNIIIENLRTKLGLPKLRPASYHPIMAYRSMTIPFTNHKKN
jgi:hypothetical protein